MTDQEEQNEEDRIYDSVVQYRELSSKREFYSMQRIDLIVVSVSTGSILALLNFIKSILYLNLTYLTILWFLSFIGFAISIGFNIRSQILSHKSNSIEAEWANKELEKLNGVRQKNTVGENKDYEKSIPKLNNASYWSLAISFVVAATMVALIIF